MYAKAVGHLPHRPPHSKTSVGDHAPSSGTVEPMLCRFPVTPTVTRSPVTHRILVVVKSRPPSQVGGHIIQAIAIQMAHLVLPQRTLAERFRHKSMYVPCRAFTIDAKNYELIAT
jgi:hypothetical protein